MLELDYYLTKWCMRISEAEESIKLSVKGILKGNNGQFKIYLSGEDKERFGFSTGDILSLIKSAKTVGICSELKEIKPGTIGLNPTMRKNCGAKINDKVEIKKIHPVDAKKIVFKPFGLNLTIRKLFSRMLKRFLKGNPVTINDVIMFSKDITREVPLIITEIEPLDFCLVAGKTKIEVDTDISEKFETL